MIYLDLKTGLPGCNSLKMRATRTLDRSLYIHERVNRKIETSITIPNIQMYMYRFPSSVQTAEVRALLRNLRKSVMLISLNSFLIQRYWPNEFMITIEVVLTNHHSQRSGNPPYNEHANKWIAWVVTVKSKHFLARSTTMNNITALSLTIIVSFTNFQTEWYH